MSTELYARRRIGHHPIAGQHMLQRFRFALVLMLALSLLSAGAVHGATLFFDDFNNFTPAAATPGNFSAGTPNGWTVTPGSGSFYSANASPSFNIGNVTNYGSLLLIQNSGGVTTSTITSPTFTSGAGTLTISISAATRSTNAYDLFQITYYGGTGTINVLLDGTPTTISQSFTNPIATNTGFAVYTATVNVAAGNHTVGLQWVAPAVTINGHLTDDNTSGFDSVQVTGPVLPLPPTLAEAFSPTSVPLGGNSTLTFTVTNPNAGSGLTGIGFTDTLPAGLVVATPNGLTNTAGGTATATAGSNSISLSGGTLAASASGTITVNVTPTSAGSQVNTTSVISSTEGGAGAAAAATLTVIAPPTLGIAFNPTSIPVGSNSTLTFTVTNPNAGSGLAGIGFSDTLPTGLVVATPSGLTGSVGGGTITAVAGSSSISLAGATLAGGTSASFSVNVTAASIGASINTTGAIASTNGGTGLVATATLTVVGIIPPIAFTSAASAYPDPAIQDIPVTFMAAASPATAVFTWNFGDGSPTATGSPASHIYTVAGTYTVTVTASDPVGGGSATQTFTLVMADVTAGNSATLPGTLAIKILHGHVRLYPELFQARGTVAFPAGTSFAGANMTVSVNGFSETFTLSPGGTAHTADGRVSFRRNLAGGDLTAFNVALFGSKLAAGLGSNVTLDSKQRPNKLLIEFKLNSLTGSYIAPLIYSTTGFPGLARFGQK